MGAIFGFIISLINPLASIAGKIADARVALAVAATDKERIAAQEHVEILQARRDVMVAEAAGPYGWVNALMRGLLAAGPTVFLVKVFIWDKVLKLGSTDPLDSNLWNVVMVVLGFYFLDNMVARFKR